MVRVVRILATIVCLLAATRGLAGGIHPEHPEDSGGGKDTKYENFYTGVINAYDHHRKWFDVEHPFFAKLIEDPRFLERVLKRFEAHHHSFDGPDAYLWRFLEGYREFQAAERSLGSISPPNNAAGSGGVGNGQIGGGGTVGAQGVPEPTSGVLMIAALVAGSLEFARRKLARRWAISGS